MPPKDGKQVAEKLLGARLVDPLGGKYVLDDGPDGTQRWTSTALKDSRGGLLSGSEPPEGYQAPPLSWFRGLTADAVMTQRALSAQAEVIMQLPK